MEGYILTIENLIEIFKLVIQEKSGGVDGDYYTKNEVNKLIEDNKCKFLTTDEVTSIYYEVFGE